MGVLIGIAQRVRPRAPMTALASAEVTVERGVADDYRGRLKPGGRNRRQVSIMMEEDWHIALAELGATLDPSLRRANLVTRGIVLQREPGSRLRIGSAVLELTVECDPCKRMDEILPGLWHALIPDWRGGRLSRVAVPGRVELGDPVSID